MALFFITGVAGTGKTTVKYVLRNRGYTAYDTDNFSVWRERSTGKTINKPDDLSSKTKEWYDKHDWCVDVSKVKNMFKEAKKKTVFLCGSISNENEVWKLFAKAYCLHADENTIRHRIKTRTDNSFGKAPDELENILKWRNGQEKWYSNRGAIIIDANQSAEKVVDDILDKVNHEII